MAVPGGLQDFVTESDGNVRVEHGLDVVPKLRKIGHRLGIEDGEDLLQIPALHPNLQRLQDILGDCLLQIEWLLGALGRRWGGIVRSGSGWLLCQDRRCNQQERPKC
jgi:hypothetical protein